MDTEKKAPAEVDTSKCINIVGDVIGVPKPRFKVRRMKKRGFWQQLVHAMSPIGFLGVTLPVITVIVFPDLSVQLLGLLLWIQVVCFGNLVYRWWK